MTERNHSAAFVLGRGIVSALGTGVDPTRSGIRAGTAAEPALPKNISTELKLPVFEVDGFGACAGLPGGRCTAMLKKAIDEALAEAGISPEDLKSLRVGGAMGTTVSCQLNSIPFYAALRKGEPVSAEPLRSYVDGNPAEWVRREYSLQGPALTVSNACASGTDAIGIAMLWLRAGIVDIAIAGGADEMNKVPYDGFFALGVCSEEPCRPFDADRKGLNLGEGAAVVVLGGEGMRRGSRFALTGYGKTADAFHITRPAPDGAGLESAIRNALADAGAASDEIDYINAHGTGTDTNDRTESAVLGRVFGPDVRFSSTKAMTGHTLGAAGAIECVLSLIALEDSVVPGNLRFARLAPDMPVAPVAETAPLPGMRKVLSVSVAFGGSNSAIAMERV